MVSAHQASYNSAAPLADQEFQIFPDLNPPYQQQFVEYDYKYLTGAVGATTGTTITLDARKDTNKLILIVDQHLNLAQARTVTLPRPCDCIGKRIDLAWINVSGTLTADTVINTADSTTGTSLIAGHVIVPGATAGTTTTLVGSTNTAITAKTLTFTAGVETGTRLKFISAGDIWIVEGVAIGSTAGAFA